MAVPHLFVTMGNLLNLRCDAWLAPTDQRLDITPGWANVTPGLRAVLDTSADEAFRTGKTYALPANIWPRDEPLPVFTSVPVEGVRSADELQPRIAAFLRTAAEAVCKRRTAEAVKRRSMPLLAIPFFGTDAGGGDLQRGDIMRTILATVTGELPGLGCDVVLVLRDEAAFALAQDLRRRTQSQFWGSLGNYHLAEAKVLAQKARSGRLVPFMGAGVSVTAGAPSWEVLIERLALRVGLGDEFNEGFAKLSPLDQANILQTLHDSRSVISDGQTLTFGETVAALVDVDKYGLAPSLLANLPSDGAITLNYDSLFEKASADAGRHRAIIPTDTANYGDTNSRWLLKLHGSVSQPDSIVLTREDYLGYNSNREALSALVKAHLMTHHLLFVGFGLKDDHFHEIIHDVRRALPGNAGSGPTLGTVLTLKRDHLQELAWRDRPGFVTMESDSSDDEPRTLEVFLDALICYSIESHSYLLAPKYEQGLNAKEQQLRREILRLKTLPAANGTSSVVGVIDDMLRRLGWSSEVSYETELRRTAQRQHESRLYRE